MKHMTLVAVGSVLTMIAAGPVAAADNAQPNGPDEGPDATSLSRMFHKLDANGDGLLSEEEAQSDPTVGSAYDSFDTGPTIEDSAKNSKPGGITLDQFKAGMQAAANGGVVGAPASGGESYLVYPDGSIEPLPDTGIQNSSK